MYPNTAQRKLKLNTTVQTIAKLIGLILATRIAQLPIKSTINNIKPPTMNSARPKYIKPNPGKKKFKIAATQGSLIFFFIIK